jgi:nucleotide-binding universal stress UspA family protein
MLNIKKILFPTDFSETSKYAMDYAIEFAKAFNAELNIIHVLFDETQVVAFYLPQITFQDMEKEIEEASEVQLKKFVEDYEALKDIKYTTMLIKGTPFVEIIRAAKDYNSDLIIIGTHGRSGLEHVLFGSTAEKVVRKASCPVLTVGLKDRKFKMP